MESGGILRGVRVDPTKRFCRTFWGVSYLLRGSNPLTPQSNTALHGKWLEHVMTIMSRWTWSTAIRVWCVVTSQQNTMSHRNSQIRNTTASWAPAGLTQQLQETSFRRMIPTGTRCTSPLQCRVDSRSATEACRETTTFTAFDLDVTLTSLNLSLSRS